MRRIGHLAFNGVLLAVALSAALIYYGHYEAFVCSLVSYLSCLIPDLDRSMYIRKILRMKHRGFSHKGFIPLWTALIAAIAIPICYCVGWDPLWGAWIGASAFLGCAGHVLGDFLWSTQKRMKKNGMDMSKMQ